MQPTEPTAARRGAGSADEEREAQIKEWAESYSGLQYVVTGTHRQWPWTSTASVNQIVDLVRAIPDILAALDAARSEAAALRGALTQIVQGPCLKHCDTFSGAPCSCWMEVADEALAARPGAAATKPSRPLHEYPHADETSTCERCGERGHWWCLPSRVRFKGRGVPNVYPDDFEGLDGAAETGGVEP